MDGDDIIKLVADIAMVAARVGKWDIGAPVCNDLPEHASPFYRNRSGDAGLRA